jgi:hypothetical protein
MIFVIFAETEVRMNGVYNGGAGGSHHEPDPALYAWTEVTGSFLASCQELQLGELLHDDMFGLFEVGTVTIGKL